MPRDPEADWNGLLGAAIRGDRRAYARFLGAVTPLIRGIVRARGRDLNESAVEDIVQDVLLAVHSKRHTWRETHPVRPWLYAITRHKVIDAFRRRGRIVDVPIDGFEEILPAPEAADPTELSDMLRVIAELAPREAAIVRAIGLEGADVEETAARHGMSVVAVRVSLHRSLRRLAALRSRMIE